MINTCACKDCGSTTRKLIAVGARTWLCTTCKRTRAKTRRETNRVAARAKMGITPEREAAIMAAQSGVCGICGPWTGRRGVSRALAADHDHKCCPGRYSCGKCLRGFLCSTCNRALGDWRDNPEIFIAAARYLYNPPAKKHVARA